MSFQNKTFKYQIYSSTGVFINTWTSDVINDPNFKLVINSGVSELQIKLARKFDSINETDSNRDINFRNEVQLWIYDKEAPNGLLIYDGFISDYAPYVDSGQEYIIVTCLGYVDDLQFSDLIVGGNTFIQYNQQDPGFMINDLLAKSSPIKITATYPGTIGSTGQTLTSSFNNITALQAIQKSQQISLVGWNWYVGADNILNFKQSSITADHNISIGKDITKFDCYKTIRDLKNQVRFIGGFYDPARLPTDVNWNPTVQLYTIIDDVPSQTSYGKRTHTIIDKNVNTYANAKAQCDKYLIEHKDPLIRATVEIIDSNGDDNFGYDIENLKPGDTIQILNAENLITTGSLSNSQVFIIQTIQYQYDKAVLEISASGNSTSRAPYVAINLQNQIIQFNQSIVATSPITPQSSTTVGAPGAGTGIKVDTVFGPATGSSTGNIQVYDDNNIQTIQGGQVVNLSATPQGLIDCNNDFELNPGKEIIAQYGAIDSLTFANNTPHTTNGTIYWDGSNLKLRVGGAWKTISYT